MSDPNIIQPFDYLFNISQDELLKDSNAHEARKPMYYEVGGRVSGENVKDKFVDGYLIYALHHKSAIIKLQREIKKQGFLFHEMYIIPQVSPWHPLISEFHFEMKQEKEQAEFFNVQDDIFTQKETTPEGWF